MRKLLLRGKIVRRQNNKEVEKKEKPKNNVVQKTTNKPRKLNPLLMRKYIRPTRTNKVVNNKT